MSPPHSIAVDFVAGRLAHPPTAAHLPLGQWLPPSQLALLVDPEPGGVSPELSARRFFFAPVAGEREALRCTTRAGLIAQLSPEVEPPRLSSGAFRVRKVEADRLIGDRRPYHGSHALESPAGCVSLGAQP